MRPSRRIALVLVPLCVLVFWSLWSASRPYQQLPLSLLEKLFSAEPAEEPLTLPRAEPGAGDPVEMVLVPAGAFLAGFDDERFGWSARRVHLEAFWIDIHEVTNQQYARFVEGAPYPEPAYVADPRYNQPDAPVVGVSWYDARAYCWWTRKRLPTETEWEKAARGQHGPFFPWGDEYAPHRANLYGAEDGYDSIAPVGSFPAGASPFGALDMVGNVWEWCSDWHDPGYYSRLSERDHQGPYYGHFRVVRGGSWVSSPDFARGFVRDRLDPNVRGIHFGFRCARTAE